MTAASPSPLRISPSDLTFSPSKSRAQIHVARLTLYYPVDHQPSSSSFSSRPLGFKVKTNAPGRYSVKPVMGLLAPGSQIDVHVRCEGLGVVRGDRFLIQAVLLTEMEASSLTPRSWRRLEDHRLHSIFIPCTIPGSDPGPSPSSSLPLDSGDDHHDPLTSLTRRRSPASSSSSSPQSRDKALISPHHLPTSTPDSPSPLSSQVSSLLPARDKDPKTRVPLLVVSCACILLGFLVPTFHPFHPMGPDASSAGQVH
ncbi:MAG: hypothetical protein DHS80DRAFT_22310 [Piptocephalis tieghemiana]|nr:MAG: hypothetical protein DHS80DRAFT_22310 [Piptocephalis tieghemiana]